MHPTTSSHDHGSIPPRPIPTSTSAHMDQQGPSSDPHVESSSKENDSNPIPRSTAAPPEGTTSGGAKDLLTLTALYTLVSAQGKRIGCLESDLQAHKLLFKDVMGKLLAKAAAIAAETSSVPADATQATGFPPSSFIHTNVPTGAAYDFSADLSHKGQSPMVEEDPPIKEREQEEMKKKRQEDVINSAKYYNDDDWSDIMGQVHANKGLTADLLGPDVNEDNFAARMAAIIAKRRRKFAAQRRSLKRPGADVEQPGSKKSKSSAAPQTPVPAATHPSSAGVTPNVHQSPFVDTPPHSPKASSHPDVTPATSVDPTVAPTLPFATPVSRSSRPRTRSQSFDADIKTYSTRRKSLAPRKMPSSEVDLNAPDTSFIKVLSDDVSDASDDDTDPLFWHIFDAWEVIPTGLGNVNALYFTDKTSKYFTHLREILHLIDRQDLSKLYGMVVKHYEVNPLTGNGLILWGDLHVLFESTTGSSSVEVWNDQQEWVIHSWKLFPFSGVPVLETFSGKILYMFAYTPYPLSVSLMKKMLKHKLEVEIDGPNRLASPRVNGYLVKASSNPFTFYDSPLPGVNTPWDVMRIVCNPELMDVAESKVIPAGRYVVPTGKDNVIVSAGRTNVIPAGSTILVLVVLCLLLRVSVRVS
ncbi:hypothetical protein Tco_0149953 [Tanacetum coccineum]